MFDRRYIYIPQKGRRYLSHFPNLFAYDVVIATVVAMVLLILVVRGVNFREYGIAKLGFPQGKVVRWQK